MRDDVINTLEVFRYACSHQSQHVIWDQQALKRIEKQLLINPKLDRLHALIYQNAIERNQLAWFDASTQTILKKTTYSIVADIAAKRAFIQQLAAALEHKNIAIILLKGMAFNDVLYPTAAPRGTSDIDILIKPADKENFELVLKELAKPVKLDNEHPFDGLYEQSWIVLAGANQFIDVHTSLTNPLLFNVNYDMLWQTSYKHPTYQSENVRLMDNENTYAYLITHMINDTNFYHYNLIDIHELLAKNTLQPIIVEQVIREWGVSKASKYVRLSAETHLLTNFDPKYSASDKGGFFDSFNWFFVKQVMLVSASDKSVLQRIKQIVTYFLFVDSTKNVLKLIKKYLLIRFTSRHI
ncbi:nucleotidyltransferase family protein [Paraglaciecola hydrolytica]|uniref:Nucleotidyltransferase n=1 Tax=Paraglaciecola hydrolytica TaxID=1799789 RepID=A0A148KLV8_9ALTE|nr:nucleotidyltransferase family protein [Paraglaciecola hydrolytica]KXI27225.1 hypothetical protein AX660_21060 [Paraglaciecola hydrolytica]